MCRAMAAETNLGGNPVRSFENLLGTQPVTSRLPLRLHQKIAEDQTQPDYRTLTLTLFHAIRFSIVIEENKIALQ